MFKEDLSHTTKKDQQKSCSICNSQVIDPLILNCSHSICFSCACQNEKTTQDHGANNGVNNNNTNNNYNNNNNTNNMINNIGNHNINVDQDFEYQINEEEQQNTRRSGSFIRQSRQNQTQAMNMQGSNQIGPQILGISQQEIQRVDQIKQQLFGQIQQQQLKSKQLNQQHQQCKQTPQQQNISQASASPKFLQRCKSESKTSKAVTASHSNLSIPQMQQQYQQANMAISKSNQKSPNSYMNIFSSRQNQQQDQRQQTSCITPEKLTEKILEMSSPDPLSQRGVRNISVSPNKFCAESQQQMFLPNSNNSNNQSNQTMIRQKGSSSSCEKPSSMSNLLIKDQKIQFADPQLQLAQNSTQNQNSGQLIMDKKCETAISECAEHKEPYSLFCDTDKKLCCVDCIYKGQGNHKNHNVIPLKQSFNLLKQELGNFKSKQKDKLHQIDESIRIQTLNRQQILKTFFSYKEIVNKEFQKLIQTIQQRQSVVLDEINSAFSHKLMDAEENLRLLQEIRIEFKNFKELENAQKNGNFLQQVKIYSVKQQLTKSLKQFEGIAIVENTKEEINQFDFQSKHQIMLEINQLGRIKNNSSAKSQTQKQYLQLQQQQQQVSQKQGPSSSYFNTIKHSTSPNNAVRTTLKIDNDPQDKPESDGMEQFTQRNLDLKLSLNAAGIRASLETPSGQNSINSRQIYQSSSQRPKSPQPNNSSHSIQNQTQMQNSHSHGLLLPSQNQHASNQHSQNQPSYSQLSQNQPKDNNYNPPLQMDHMNVFAADQQIQQNTVQTERQSCTSHTSKKSFMFNEKPPLQTVKKQYGNQHLKTEGGDNQGGPLHYPNQIQEQDQKLKLNKCYNSSSQQNLFISNDGQFLNSPAQNLPSKINHGPISTQSDSSSQNQVLFQTSGSYSTKKTQYSSNSQNNGKFSSLSAQIKQITQNIPDYFENADYDVIQLGEMDKENAFQEPEEQMTYLNSVSSRKEHIGQSHAQQQQQQKLPSSGANNGNQNQVTPTQIKYEKLGFSQQKKAVQTNTQKEQSQIERFKALNENTGINNSTNNIKGTKVFDDKTYFILNQTQQNTTMNNTTSNSFLMNTSQISNIQADNSKSQTFLNASGKTNQILNSGSLTKRGNVNKFFNNESLENSNEGNKELIKQLNEEILYENFQHHQERDEKNMSLSAQLIESMNLKEKDHEQMTNRNNNNNPNSSNSVKNITEQQGSFQNSGIVPSPFFNESRILDNKSKEQLINILPFKCKSTSLLYSASEDRLSSDLFHEKCDGRGPYLIIVKANSYVFGYYSPISFVKCDKYITCSNSFIFTLNNIYNTAPMIFPVKQDKKFIALYQSVKNPCLGSTLQNKQDLWINFDDPRNSFSCLGYAYKIEGQFDGNKILAGQYTDWNVQGIEIFNASQ